MFVKDTFLCTELNYMLKNNSSPLRLGRYWALRYETRFLLLVWRILVTGPLLTASITGFFSPAFDAEALFAPRSQGGINRCVSSILYSSIRF